MKNNNQVLSQQFSMSSTIYKWLFDHEFIEGYSKHIEKIIATLIIFSVLAIVLENTPEIYQPHAWAFHWFDVITVAIFSFEYVLRLFTANSNPDFAHKRFPRLSYFFSFYALIDFIAIAPFYFAQIAPVDVEMLRILRIMRLARMFKLSRQLVPAWREFSELNKNRSFRAKVYALLEPTGHSGQLHIIVDNFIVFWIALSILCVVLETVDQIHALFYVEFYWIDIIAFSIFTIEYIARLYSAPENPAFHSLRFSRLRHIRSAQAIIDLLTILPFFLESFFKQHVDLRFLRVFRLLRMLKLTRYTSATDTLLKVVKREWQVISAAIFVMFLLVVLTASMGFIFENAAQPDKFENIPQSIYWAVITLASVGYGDISPITPMGRALTVILSLVGIGIFAIPAGLLASAFTDQLRIDRESFKRTLAVAYADEKIEPREQEHIIAEAERLHLSDTEFELLLLEAKEDYEKSKAVQELSFGHLLLDPTTHPEFAAEQFRILVAQLRLLSKAVAHASIVETLSAKEMSDELTIKIAQLVAEYGKKS